MAVLRRGPERHRPVLGHRRRPGDALTAIRALLLDAGHTLVYAEPAIEEVYGAAFRRHGLPVSAEAVAEAIAATWAEVSVRRQRGEEPIGADGGDHGFWFRFVLTTWRRLGGDELPEPLLPELVAHFASESSWRVYPDVLPALEELKALGLRLAVVSNWDTSLPALLSRLGLSPYFETLVVSALVGTAKPGRPIFEEALRRLGVEAYEALHVGDSLADDYHGARAAGLSAILLDRPGKAGGNGVLRVTSLAELPGRLAPLAVGREGHA